MLSNVLAALVIWGVGALTLYWNLEGRGVLPSNAHVRVLAVLWPLALVAAVGLGIMQLTRWLTRAAVVDTVVAFHTVGEWRYHNGRILAPPKPTDPVDRAAAEAVERLLRGEDI